MSLTVRDSRATRRYTLPVDTHSLLEPAVWAPLAVGLFGLLVSAGGVRDLLRNRRKRAGSRHVPGLVVEMVDVHVTDDLRPFGAPVVEYVDGGATRRFQAGTVPRTGYGKHACAVGDRVNVLIPAEGGAPELDQPVTNTLTALLTIAFGLVIVAVAPLVRLMLTQ